MTANTSIPGPLAGTPEWKAQREEEIKRLGARARYRSTSRESPKLRGLRAEMTHLVIADSVEPGADSEKRAQRMFELQQQIRREQEHASPSPPPYSATARTAASARVPGEDDE